MSFNLDDYEPVAARIGRFYADHPNGAIHTDIIFDDGVRVVIRATVFRDIADPMPAGIDFAEEVLTDRGVNSTSRIENCSTSAQGRALAAIAYASTDWQKKASREEMSKVQRMSGGAPTAATTSSGGASPAQIGKIRALCKANGQTGSAAMLIARDKLGVTVRELDELDKRQASQLIEYLIANGPGEEAPF